MKRLTNLLAITLLTSVQTAFAQEQEETTTGKSAVEQSADIYASGYNKFRFGGYGEILANFMDYGINRFRGTDNGVVDRPSQFDLHSSFCPGFRLQIQFPMDIRSRNRI